MHRRLVVIATVLVVVACGCSGSDSESNEVQGSSPDGAVGTTVPAETGDVEPTDTGDGTIVSVDEFCAAISAIQSAEFELEETFGPEARQLFDDVQSAAPPEIAADVAIVIGTLDALAELGISADENDPVAVGAASEILLDPEYTDANADLVAYTSQECEIDLAEGDDADIDLEELDVGDVDP